MIQIKLERIGDNIDAYAELCRKEIDEAITPGFGNIIIGREKLCNAWCAEIIGFHPIYTFDRVFLNPSRDYTHANSIGSRGVYDFYNLEEGKLYDISSPISWKRVDRYFCLIQDNNSIRLNKKEAIKWISCRLGSMS